MSYWEKKAKPYSPYVFPNVLIIFFISFIYAQTAKGTNLPLYNYWDSKRRHIKVWVMYVSHWAFLPSDCKRSAFYHNSMLLGGPAVMSFSWQGESLPFQSQTERCREDWCQLSNLLHVSCFSLTSLLAPFAAIKPSSKIKGRHRGEVKILRAAQRNDFLLFCS